MEQNKKHTVQLEYGQGFFATGIVEVVVFNEKEMVLRLDSGEKLCVLGENLKINAFNKQQGELCVVGSVAVVKYLNSAKQKIKKLFG